MDTFHGGIHTVPPSPRGQTSWPAPGWPCSTSTHYALNSFFILWKWSTLVNFVILFLFLYKLYFYIFYFEIEIQNW
jgi:hypothetical protein